MATAVQDLRPPVEIRKRMLEAKISEWQQQGYALELQVSAVEAQTPESEDEARKTQDSVASMRRQVDNCYAAAAKLKKELEELSAQAAKEKDKKV